MQIVINTQIKENYGAHDWDGVGTCPQYWKFKGGRTFVISNVSVEQAQDTPFWDNAIDAVTCADEYYEEYVLDSQLLDDGAPVNIEPWETVISLEKDIFTDGFVALQTVVNDRYASMKFPIAKKFNRWLQISGEQIDYSCSYEFANGHVLPYKEAMAYLAKIDDNDYELQIFEDDAQCVTA